MKAKQLFFYPACILPLTFILNATAEEYYWEIQPEVYAWPEPQKKHQSPELACRYLHENTGYKWMEYDSVVSSSSEDQWYCNFIYDPHPDEDKFGASINRIGDSCSNGKTFNKLTGQCEVQTSDSTCPSNMAGNPINFISGYKIEKEQDLPLNTNKNNINNLNFSKYYSSVDGLWKHSYSSRLRFEPDVIMLIHADGQLSYFDKKEEFYNARPPENGKLTYSSDYWTYESTDNVVSNYDMLGNLAKIQKPGLTLSVSYTDKNIVITDQFENSLHVIEDLKKQPLTVKTDDIEIQYNYNNYKQLTSMLVTVQGQSKRREYVYGNPHDSRLLTGIIDERGIRYATWTYDEQGRATSSEHSKGVGKTSIDYHVDGSTTVTNELGKKTKYQFEIVQGIKRITSVVGLTTANCPNSNSTFTYDSNGLLKTKTDNKGNVTIYTYDDRGLEIHRTEASGTSVSRTIETEWHPAFSLPVQITETNRKTRYTYDKQGRQISKTVTSR